MATQTHFATLPVDEQQRLLNKLAKLKALSECKTGNVNETATAAAAMTRLMLEYQIEVADLNFEDSSAPRSVAEEDVDGRVSLRGFPAWQCHLLTALADVNNCISFTSSQRHYNFFHENTESRLRLIGAPSDIANVRQLFSYCVLEIERLCKGWGVGLPLARKNDFRRGAAHGIADKVQQEREAVLAEERARAEEKGQASRSLALFDSKLEAAYQKAREIGLTFTRRTTRPVSQRAYEAGYQAGASLPLNGTPQALPSR